MTFRYILFALFWLAWLAMFAGEEIFNFSRHKSDSGAILIVLLSPKCAAKQEPDWWQTKVSYQVDSNRYSSSFAIPIKNHKSTFSYK